MNKIRNRIAVLAGSSVVITIMIVMVIFNITIRHKTERDAFNALNSQRAAAEDYELSVYNPETIIIRKKDEKESEAPVLYSLKDKSIIDWVNVNEAKDISRAVIDGNTYYILKVEEEDIAPDFYVSSSYVATDDTTDSFVFGSEDLSMGISIFDNTSIDSLISYVDVSGEMKMIKQIDIFFILTALLVGTLSTASGYYLGRKLEQNQLAQKNFFENTSHELKTPLTAIQGYAEGIQSGVITDLAKTGQIISAQTSKMSRMIEEILCIARIESGAVQLEKETVSLDELIQDCLMPLEGVVKNKALDVKLELSEIKVSADVDRLEHAISNLLMNAVKYAQTKVAVSCTKEGISISNDCAPLSDDTFKHIFDRFYTGRDGNTGIGLSLAKELIELHGWNISAERITDGILFRIVF